MIEFENQTDTAKLSGMIFGCERWDEETKKHIIATQPDLSMEVKANINDVKIKKNWRRSYRLKIRVSSKVKVGDNYIVLIMTYKMHHFGDYFFIEFDKEGRIIVTCKRSEIY